MLLKLYNNTTKKEIVFENMEDTLKSRMFYSFNITLPEGVDDGEYTYRLYDGEKQIAIGLCQIGDYKRDVTVHNNDKNGYITYNG